MYPKNERDFFYPNKQKIQTTQFLVKADGTAFCIVTHDAAIAKTCDRIVSIVDGRLV
jgi:predicted ABC-type transport system involved in lysophospholipase L1 biosynthesis ATPase subunit